ncbi:MAG: hypothetical protein LWX83_05105 [Anaerolineae bacterium]|nr:hypothetical protein [Anaerolineae bacterium]
MLKRVLISLVVLLVVACLCMCALLIPAGVLAVRDGYKILPSLPGQAATPEPTRLPTLEVRPDTSNNIPQDVALQMDQIEAEVSELRGLSLMHSFKRDTLSPAQLQRNVTEDFFKDYTDQDASDDTLLYNILGLLEPGKDLLNIYHALYSEQVAGYYDPEAKEMYVVQGNGFNGTERMTYAHEFTHTLQDQHYDMTGRLKITDAYCRVHTEYCTAVTALMEGDAVSSEQTWFFTYGSESDRREVQDFYSTYASPVYDASPEFLKEDLLFPYHKGFEFVQSLYDQGGWQAVDAAYANPPVSSEQIMHPNLYPAEKPVHVPAPQLKNPLGDGWRLAGDGSLGEWNTFLLLSRDWDPAWRLPDVDAYEAAAGWGGDHYLLYQKVNDPAVYAFVIEWKWDSLKDADQFWQALQEICKQRWGEPLRESSMDARWEYEDGSQINIHYIPQGTRWVIASNQTILNQIASALE